MNKEPLVLIVGVNYHVKEGSLAVWWWQNAPGNIEWFHVGSPKEAVELINQFAERDLHDPAILLNSCGLLVWDGDEWTEWYNEEGEDINQYAARLEEEETEGE